MRATLRLTVSIMGLAVSNLSAATLYVSEANLNPKPPYATWSTAATNIQDAVEAAAAGDTVLVTNGVYAGGVVLSNPLTLVSVNGPQVTVIDGGGTNQCVSMTMLSSLSGFTITHGFGMFCGGVANGTLYNCVLSRNVASLLGGGATSATLYSCLVVSNRCESGSGGGVASGHLQDCVLNGCVVTGNYAASGGGASTDPFGTTRCVLNNCIVADNSAEFGSAGAEWSSLYDCTLTGNYAADANSGVGGASHCTLDNCIVYFNTSSNSANYDTYCVLNYCCTSPLPQSGTGNIALDPLFLNYSAGNRRLQANSPCINAGNNAFVSGTTDLDGNPRIVGGTVDMGAYEFQAPTSLISYAWLQQYGFPTDGSADFLDIDHDGMNNWQEWVCGTDPTNKLSVLRMLSAAPAATNVTVSWQSVAGVNYFLERSTNLSSPFTLEATNIVGQAGTTTYNDPNAADPGPCFYRVGVKDAF